MNPDALPMLMLGLGAIIVVSAAIKSAVVLNLLRSAFGGAEVPPAIVALAMSFLLALMISAPLLQRLGVEAERGEVTLSPLRDFLEKNSATDARERFAALLDARSPLPAHEGTLPERGRWIQEAIASSRALPQPQREPWLEALGAAWAREASMPPTRRFAALAPAFLVTELTEGFLIGFLLLLPFLVIDLLVSTLLVAAGLSSVQPVAVSLPLKLLLFIVVDGWQLLLEALITGY